MPPQETLDPSTSSTAGARFVKNCSLHLRLGDGAPEAGLDDRRIALHLGGGAFADLAAVVEQRHRAPADGGHGFARRG